MDNQGKVRGIVQDPNGLGSEGSSITDTNVCGTVVSSKDVCDGPSETTETQPVVESPSPIVSDSVSMSMDCHFDRSYLSRDIGHR